MPRIKKPPKIGTAKFIMLMQCAVRGKKGASLFKRTSNGERRDIKMCNDLCDLGLMEKTLVEKYNRTYKSRSGRHGFRTVSEYTWKYHITQMGLDHYHSELNSVRKFNKSN